MKIWDVLQLRSSLDVKCVTWPAMKKPWMINVLISVCSCVILDVSVQIGTEIRNGMWSSVIVQKMVENVDQSFLKCLPFTVPEEERGNLAVFVQKWLRLIHEVSERIHSLLHRSCLWWKLKQRLLDVYFLVLNVRRLGLTEAFSGVSEQFKVMQ